MIPIRNIFHMLAYAFTSLKTLGVQNVCTEEFEHIADLYAEILIQGVTLQLKRGIARTYEERDEESACLRGKLLVNETIGRQTLRHGRVFCRHSEFTEDNALNRILCSTMEALTKTSIERDRKKRLLRLLQYFPHVKRIPLPHINWNIHYNRQNQNYRMLVGICRLVAQGLLQGQQEGDTKLEAFEDDDRMNDLYERFVRNYYRTTFPRLNVNASQIDWQIEEGDSTLLPTLRTDVTISDKRRKRTLIIDTKYYKRILKEHYGAQTHDRANLTQVLNYVDQLSHKLGPEYQVSGMLLYAGTDETQCMDKEFVTCGKRMAIRILDLNTEFSQIERQLKDIVEHYFGEEAVSSGK